MKFKNNILNRLLAVAFLSMIFQAVGGKTVEKSTLPVTEFPLLTKG